MSTIVVCAHLALVVICCCLVANGLQPQLDLELPAQTFKPEDFIIVVNSDQHRLAIALASRPLRVGIRTFIALDDEQLVKELNAKGNEHNETYAYFPNRSNKGHLVSKPGDTRWTAAPFLAHHHYGRTYKWILLGDDDTLWFLNGARLLLRHYDARLPYAISDHFGDHNNAGYFVPSPWAAVCLPCHWATVRPRLHGGEHADDTDEELAAGSSSRRSDAKRQALMSPARTGAAAALPGNLTVDQLLAMELNTTALHSAADGIDAMRFVPEVRQANFAGGRPLLPLIGCPCTPDVACRHRFRLCRRYRCGPPATFRGNGTMCRHSWAHGGAGMALSAGLMVRLAGGRAERCAASKVFHSCDMNLALCLQQSGIAFTHAGYALLHNSSWSDPRFIVFDNPVHPRVVRDPLALLQGRVECVKEADQGLCRWLVRHAVTVHLHARGYGTYELAAAMVGAVAAHHLEALKLLEAEGSKGGGG